MPASISIDTMAFWFPSRYWLPIRPAITEHRSRRSSGIGGDNGLDLPLATLCRMNAQCVMPVVYALATRPLVLDVIEGILGPDILIYSAKFFLRNAQSDQFVSMHKDLTCWGMGTMSERVTAWVALSPATPESGCMDFVWGSHKSAILPHKDTFDDKNLPSRRQAVQVDVHPEDKTPILLQPGQMSLHHGLTIRGSGPNTSDDRRIAAVMRSITPRVSQNVADKDDAMVVRGADRVGNFIHDAPPLAQFTPQSVALYTEIRAARAKAMRAGTSIRKGTMPRVLRRPLPSADTHARRKSPPPE